MKTMMCCANRQSTIFHNFSMAFFRITQALVFSAAVLPVAIAFQVPLTVHSKDATDTRTTVSRRSARWQPTTRVISSTRRNYSPNEDNDSGEDPVQTLSRIFGTPTPLVPDLPLGYPVALLVAVIIFFPTPVAAIAPVVLFGVFRYLGSDYFLLEEDQDNDNIDSPLPVNLVAFVAALLSSFLIVPAQSNTTIVTTSVRADDPGAIPVALLLVVAFGGALWQFLPKESEEEIPVERSRMDLWDDEFNRKSK